MNIRRNVALVGIFTLLLSSWATNLYAGSYGSVHQQQAQQYQMQPRVIIVQPNRQVSGQASRLYGQQGQVQQYNYYPGVQHQQPRYDRHNNYGQPRHRWSQPPSQQQNNQYQRPDYRAQQLRYKAQRDYEREMRDRNMDRMLRNAKPFQYQQSPQRNQHHNYGNGHRQQGPGRY